MSTAGPTPDRERAAAVAAILERYRELEALHGEMLAQAQHDDWEAVAEVAARADEVRAALAATESAGQALDPDAERTKAALVERTLATIGELRRLAEPAHASRAEQLAAGAARRKLDRTYGG